MTFDGVVKRQLLDLGRRWYIWALNQLGPGVMRVFLSLVLNRMNLCQLWLHESEYFDLSLLSVDIGE